MTIEEKVLLAQKNNSLIDEIINENSRFILFCCSRAIGKPIDKHQDEYSIGLIAFNDAIKGYNVSKGSFLSFSRIVIKNRLTDYIRKEFKNKVIPFSALDKYNDKGKNEFDAEDNRYSVSDAQIEIDALVGELKQFDISFFELSKNCPKSKKTKSLCCKIIKCILDNVEFTNEIVKKGKIPITKICEMTGVSHKICERYRKYIITVVVILSGDYYILQEYFYDTEVLK